MNKVTRRVGTMLLGAVGLMLVGCSGSGPSGDTKQEEKIGKLALPLVTRGASGTSYRLRDATFAIHHYSYLYYDYGYANAPAAAAGAGGTAGTGPGDEVITVSSETEPDAENINVSLEEGQYYIELQPGWHFEKVTPEGAEYAEATLLSGQTQWIYVSRQSTSFAQFEFGLGEKKLWLNGQVNIGVVLHEDPNELNYGGYGGTGGGFPGGAGGSGGGIPGGSGGTGGSFPAGAGGTG